MAPQVFITGFPGFIARRLVDRILDKNPDTTFTVLIEERMRGVADATIKGMERPHPGFIEATSVVTGDICRPRLGMSEQIYQEVTGRTTHVWHLAAVYDLAVPSSLAYKVNVLGTANVLDFCEDCPGLRRLDHVSTCFVSGDRTGLVLESELDQGQGFHNHYESTKCWSELEVRRRMVRLPVAIHRPAIVMGDSHTGETDKYDGLYFVMDLLRRLPSWMPMVHLGPGTALVNIVPVDFVVDAMAQLWTMEEAVGSTFHLADPYPHTMREVLEAMMSAFGFRRPLASVPPALAEQALEVETVRNLVRIPEQTVTYLNHDISFDTANQRRLLEGTGVRCPDVMTVLPALAEYVRQHPDKPFLDGRTV